ncbi:zinc finger domain-containing protein [Trichoderma novae-zelandiae]
MPANRRGLDTGSESYTISPTLENDISAALRLCSLLSAVEQDNIQAPGDLGELEQQLHSMLALRSRVSTESSNAQQHTAAQSLEGTIFRKIGAGACGAVFAQDGKSFVEKLSKTNDDSLWNDYRMHTRISSMFKDWGFTEIKVPEVYFFVPRDDPRYFEQNPELAMAASEVCNLPSSVLVSERILPLANPTRTLLIDKYCAPRIKQAAFSDAANRDCLVRPYLGSMQGKTGGLFFSLRNFKIHLNQMVELQLDIRSMASSMGTAMAIMHWAAKTDARDVEFVFGSSSKESSAQLSLEEVENLQRPTYTGPPSYIAEDFFHRSTDLWLLDFNQVRLITMDEAGVAQAVEAARINDPYLPKPLGESNSEKIVWNAFAEHYIWTADVILADSQQFLRLPRLFIRRLIETEEQRKARDS